MLHRQTKNTPFINLSAEEGLMEIKGSSYAENLSPLYNQIFDWINTEVPLLKTGLKCVFHFNVFNSVSIKNIMVILSKLNNHYNNGRGVNIKIDWYYDTEDEDHLETAQDVSDFIDIPIRIIAV